MLDDIPGSLPIVRCTFLATGFSTDAVKWFKAPVFTKKTSIRSTYALHTGGFILPKADLHPVIAKRFAIIFCNSVYATRKRRLNMNANRIRVKSSRISPASSLTWAEFREKDVSFIV